MQSGDETDSSPEAPDTDEGDNVPRRDPDAIADEIEQTRAELADTIDAIAERMNPKRAAARSAQAVKAQVSSARDKVADVATGDGGSDESPLRQAANAPVPVAPLAALVAVIALILLIMRRRHSR
jgi:Protein of unknown function (DUF3618)